MRSTLLAAVVACLLPVAASAQGSRLAYVGQVSYAADAEALGLGAGVNLHLGPLTNRLGIRLETTFDYFLVDDPATHWELNGTLLRDMPLVANLYLGAGVNYARLSVDDGRLCGVLDCETSTSEVGLNVLGGYRLGSGKAASFVQARLALGGGEQFYLTGGFRF